jgi:hypothetical protein
MDRLASIISEGTLWCDAEMANRAETGTTIGIKNIKQRRLTNELNSHPGLRVGDCVPFYLCPRSIMLFVIYKGNHTELEYRGGQGSIVHLEADLRQVVAWADANGKRWVFTSTNAGAGYFEDYSDLHQLNKLDWDAIQANDWAGARKEGKQAEFLMEHSFPWDMVSRIGVHSAGIRGKVLGETQMAKHQPPVEIKPDWYY